jgi:hypothetical protein
LEKTKHLFSAMREKIQCRCRRRTQHLLKLFQTKSLSVDSYDAKKQCLLFISLTEKFISIWYIEYFSFCLEFLNGHFSTILSFHGAIRAWCDWTITYL